MKKVETIIGSLFAVIGVCLIIGGTLWMTSCIHKENDWTKTTAVITKIENQGADGKQVWIQYEADGKTYNQSLSSYNSEMRPGKTISIWYMPENPDEIYNDADEVGYFILYGIGAIFTGIGGGMLGRKIYLKRKAEWLIENGECIEAEINEVQINYAYRVNGLHPFIISCRWREPRKRNLLFI